MSVDKLLRRQYLKYLASSTAGAIVLPQSESEIAETRSQVIVEGFEDGSLNNWTNIESAETTTSVSYAGDRSLLITDKHTVENDGKAGNSITRKVEPIAPSQLTAALRMDNESFNTVGTTWSGTDEALTVRIGYSDNGSGLAINGNVIQQSEPFSWYFIELSDIDWADSRIGEVKVNGTVVETELVSATLPETISNIKLSAHGGGTGAQGFFDEITIGTEERTQEEEDKTVTTGSWPMFQRDIGNSGFVQSGSPPVKNISTEWQYNSEKDGTTMPVVDENHVYVGFGTKRDETTQSKLLAISRADENVIWEQTFDRSIQSPAVAGGSVYIGTHESEDGNHHSARYGRMYSLNAATGEEQWQFTPVGGVSTSPTAVGGEVYFGTKGNDSGYLQGTAYAVSASDGQQLWETELGWGTFSAPAVDTDHVYIESRAEKDPFYALDRTDGSVVWEYPMPDFKGNGTVVDGTVYVTGFRNDARVVALEAQSGNEQWVIEPNSEVKTSPAVGGGKLFFGTVEGIFKAVDAKTGSQQWSATIGEPIVVAPALVGDTVYVTDRSGTVHAFAAQSGDRQLEYDITEGWITEPVIVSETVLLGSQSGTLYVLTGKTDNTGDGTEEPTDQTDNTGDGTEEPTDQTDNTGDGTEEPTDQTDNTGDKSNIVGTQEMLMIGGGGSLALLFGAYALSQQTESNDDSSKPKGSVNSDQSNPTPTTSSSISAREPQAVQNIDRHLGRAETRLSDSEQSFEEGDYEQALKKCQKAVKIATDARAIASEEIPSRVHEIKAFLDDASNLREQIETEQEAYQKSKSAINHISNELEKAEDALNKKELWETFERIRVIGEVLEESADKVKTHQFEDMGDSIEHLQNRYERLQNRADSMLGNLVPTSDSIPTTPNLTLSYQDIKDGERIGSGGNADVHHVTVQTPDGGINLAIKEPRLSDTLNTETVKELLHEAERWQKLDSHDHIVSVVDYASEPLPWIAMEYMDAGHMGNKTGTLEFERALWTAIATTKAVRHAHRRGVAHLDLKPENILFQSVEDCWEVPKVADWGLSKQLLKHSKSVEGMSPHYSAPEQFEEEYGSPDDITDVYQLGAVFYELFTGEPPFNGRPVKVMNKVMNDEPTPPSEIADVPEQLDDILLKALKTEKADRYESVLYLRDELQSLSNIGSGAERFS
jgi:outer membrane protein assembly factor BamB/HEPN domain-containing protein